MHFPACNVFVHSKIDLDPHPFKCSFRGSHYLSLMYDRFGLSSRLCIVSTQQNEFIFIVIVECLFK